MAPTLTAEKGLLYSIADRVDIAPNVAMPRLGLGTWNAQGAAVQHEIQLGVEMGYRLIDTSPNYGNEAQIGDQLAHVGLPRSEMFITTKLEGEDFGYESTMFALEGSLNRLGLDYLDLYLIHWPGPGYCCETWEAMEQLVAEGKTRSIGVSNFLPRHLHVLDKTAQVMPAVNQIEFHPYRQQSDVVFECLRRGIVVQAWGPVIRGHADEVSELVEIGQAHDKTASQVSIRWILQKGHTTIPKSVHAERLKEDADVFDFELTAEEMNAIDALDRNQHARL